MMTEYVYYLEQQWIYIPDICISENFYNKIVNYKTRLLEEGKDNRTEYCKFHFVGILCYKSEILCILPKYYKNYMDKIACINDVLRVYDKFYKSIDLKYPGVMFLPNEEEFSELTFTKYLIDDFYQNGLYQKVIYRDSYNGSGSIDWQRTINGVQPSVSEGYPIYFNTINRESVNNNYNFIVRLHDELLRYLGNKYEILWNCKFDNSKFECLQELIEDFEGTENILSTLNDEMHQVFGERDIELLQHFMRYFEGKGSDSKEDLILYGSNAFDKVWEYGCGYVFNNEYSTIKEKMPAVEWINNKNELYYNDQNKLEPDIIYSNQDYVLVLDGKYYNILWENERVSGNPGTYDIVKQYVYERILNKIYGDKYKYINCLLFPKVMESSQYHIFGKVKFDVFEQQPITNIYLDPSSIWERCIIGKPYSSEEMARFINKIDEYDIGQTD